MRVCLQPMDFMQISTIASLHSIGQSLRRLTPLTLWLKWGGGCMRSRGMWGWCLVCCGKIQYKGKYNWKFICNILSILREGDRRTGNLPPAEVFPKERLAQRLRYCRIMPMKRRNAPAWTPGQGETAPWTARFDGFVKPRKSKKHNSYSILAA